MIEFINLNLFLSLKFYCKYDILYRQSLSTWRAFTEVYSKMKDPPSNRLPSVLNSSLKDTDFLNSVVLKLRLYRTLVEL